MFGNIFKKIIPLAATAGVAYMAGSGGVGSNLFTTSSLKEKLLNFLLKILDNKSDIVDKESNLKKLNYKNSWNDVNQKLKKIINEN